MIFTKAFEIGDSEGIVSSSCVGLHGITLLGRFGGARRRRFSAVLSVDSQQRQGQETEEARALGTKAAIKRPISNMFCLHPVPSGV